MELKESIKAIQYKEPKFVDRNGDLSKKWYIDYQIFDVAKNKYVRKRYYKGINKTKNRRERYRIGYQLLARFKKELKKGVHIDSKQSSKKEFDLDNLYLLEGLKYAVNRKSATLRKNTLRDYHKLLRNIEKWIELKGLDMLKLTEFNAQWAHEYFDYLTNDLGFANKTHNNYKGYLSTLFKYFIDRYPDKIRVNPMNGINNLREESGKHKPFTAEQRKKIKAELSKQSFSSMQLFLEFLYFTATRPYSETRLLKIENILDKTIFIPAHLSKNGRGQHVAIAPQLNELIEEHKLRTYPKHYYIFTVSGIPGEQPISERAIYKRHARILGKLGLRGQGYDIYGYKHTAAIDLYIATDGDLQFIKQHFRHHSISVTEKYLRDLGMIRKSESLSKFPDF